MILFHLSSTAFTPFRSCYYLLYQCLVPNPREGLSLLVQHCSVPDDFERTILSGGIPRLCNQGILNYLLIVLRRDRDFVKFWNVVKLLIDQPELRKAVERLEKGKLFSFDSMNVCITVWLWFIWHVAISWLAVYALACVKAGCTVVKVTLCGQSGIMK